MANCPASFRWFAMMVALSTLVISAECGSRRRMKLMMLTILGSPVSGAAFGWRTRSAPELDPDKGTPQMKTRCINALEALALGLPSRNLPPYPVKCPGRIV